MILWLRLSLLPWFDSARPNSFYLPTTLGSKSQNIMIFTGFTSHRASGTNSDLFVRYQLPFTLILDTGASWKLSGCVIVSSKNRIRATTP